MPGVYRTYLYTSKLRPICFIFFLLPWLSFQAQILKGKIIDLETKEPIPFAIIILDHSNKGTTADLDGSFELALPPEAQSITVQLIGYVKKNIPITELNLSKTVTIPLKNDGFRLGEIVVKPQDNPAIPIIRKVIRNKPQFDIENLPKYICTTYAKTYFTFSDKYGNEKIKRADTADVGKLLKNSYLFFMESVTEKKYHFKHVSQEKVMASRVSGFKSAPFGAFASQLQSFTFYADNLELLGLRYVNPLSKGTFKRYNFEIADTVLTGTDTTILIKFFPKKNVKFKALKGVLYIYKNQYVLANVLAEPSELPRDGNGIKIQQLYEKVDSVHWFPKQANTEILFYGFTSSQVADTSIHASIIKGVSRMYIREVNLDSVFKIRNKSLATYNEEGFDQKPEAYWNKQRTDTLSQKENKTYRVIDSLGKKVNLDKKLKWITALSSGQLQIGYINLDLMRFMRLNDYEKVRLGAGISSSNKLSRYFSIGGYGGYGFGDKAWKYGGHLRLNLNRRQTTYFQAEAAKEVIETAGTFFLQETTSFISTEKIRDFLISKMDKVNFAKGSFNFQLFNFIKTSAYLEIQQRQSPFGYATPKDNLLINETKQFTFNQVGIQFKIWPGEKFTEMMDQYISMGSKWPAIFINLSQGMSTTLLGYKGDFEYSKIDLRIDHLINFKIKGFFSWQIQAGKVFGNVPYSLQYNNKSSRTGNYQISAEKTFETMYLNEFISTQYAALFLAINTGKIFAPNKYCNPEIELVHNFGIGTLDNRRYLTNIELNDISKGYTEAGLRLKNLLHSKFSSFGAGVYYRYGNYASETTSRNFVYKLVLGYSF